MSESGRKGYIAESIDGIISKDYDRYHTPGHKGVYGARDLTELGLCGEIFPADSIEKAQEYVATLYSARCMRFLVCGSSMGIKASLLLFRGRKVLYAAGEHVAFTQGCELAGVNAVCIGESTGGREYTRSHAEIPPPLTLTDAERALDANPDAAALFITSPDYLGRTADVRIAELCRERGVSLIADSAHGAHFAFAPGLEKYRFENIADLCNMSAHKTLGAYTQTALLAVNNPGFTEGIDRNLRLLGTTSPNYAMLERLEQSVREASRAQREYARLAAFTDKLRECAELLANTDYTRVCIKPHCGAREFTERLISRGIMPEAVLGDYAVLILTPHDDDNKLDRLYEAVKASARG